MCFAPPPLPVDATGCVTATISASDVAQMSDDTGPADLIDNDDDDEQEDVADQASRRPSADRQPTTTATAAVTCQVFLHLAGLIDLAAERDRAQSRISQIDQSLIAIKQDRSRPAYLDKVPLAKQQADERKVCW